MNVVLTASAIRELAEQPNTIQVRMIRLIERLSHWPSVSGAKPLRGQSAGKYRLRTGDYRLQFYLDAGHVIVERIGHRDGFYEE